MFRFRLPTPGTIERGGNPRQEQNRNKSAGIRLRFAQSFVTQPHPLLCCEYAHAETALRRKGGVAPGKICNHLRSTPWSRLSAIAPDLNTIFMIASENQKADGDWPRRLFTGGADMLAYLLFLLLIVVILGVKVKVIIGPP